MTLSVTTVRPTMHRIPDRVPDRLPDRVTRIGGESPVPSRPVPTRPGPLFCSDNRCHVTLDCGHSTVVTRFETKEQSNAQGRSDSIRFAKQRR